MCTPVIIVPFAFVRECNNSLFFCSRRDRLLSLCFPFTGRKMLHGRRTTGSRVSPLASF